jgi:hypothetical protein
MKHREVERWVESSFTTLRRSQQKTLAAIVFGALAVGHVTLAALGRAMAGPVLPKHRIKRVDRFLANRRIEPVEAMRGVAAQLLRPRKKRAIIAVDWVDIRQRLVLVAALCLPGRAVPLCWAAYEKWELYKSQNQLEEGLFLVLRSLIPAKVKVTIVADRGFGRAELARCLDEQGFGYVLRVKGQTYIRSGAYAGTIAKLGLRPESCRWLPEVDYRKTRSVRTRLAILWRRGAREPWLLISNVATSADAAASAYERRMRIEELFRDQKNVRNGWALRQVEIGKTERLERLLLILAAAYLVLILAGLAAGRQYDPRHWSSSSKAGSLSLWQLGRLLLERLDVKLKPLLTILQRLIAQEVCL